MREALQLLDEITLNFSQQGLFILNITLAFIMFGVALEIKIDHFRQILKKPRSAVIGYISQFFLLPAVTFLLVTLLKNHITPSVALGMILVASCPGGNISNFISALGKANAALSVSLTALATTTAIIMTPFNFALWGGLYTNLVSHIDAETLLRPLEINPYQMFKTVFLILGIPLIVGMFVNHKLPKLTYKLIKPLKILSILFFILIVAIAFRNNYSVFIHHIGAFFIVVLLHNLVALSAGMGLAYFTGLRPKDRRTITIETGIQNSGLALVLLFNPKIFPPELENGGMAIIAAWWGIWHIIAGLTIAGIWARIPIKENTHEKK
jgi:BASS family bile acid:Na+ symporter